MYGIKLRQLRRQLGLTQRQLGTLCGVGGTTISMIEHGKRLPGRETLRRLQAVLGDLPPRPAKPLPTAELLTLLRGTGSAGEARCGGCAAGPAAHPSLPPRRLSKTPKHRRDPQAPPVLYSLAGSALRGFFRLRCRGSRFGRRVLRGNAFIAEFLHQGINHRKGRDPQHHAGNAHQVAAHR